jgi:hypothetical protein
VVGDAQSPSRSTRFGFIRLFQRNRPNLLTSGADYLGYWRPCHFHG